MAIWPTRAATDADLYVAVNALQTTLASNISNSVTTVPITSTTNFPTAGGVTIDQEVIFYTGISGGNLTGCTRGADGTVAASHTSGVPVSATIIAWHHNGLMYEIEAIESWLLTNAVSNPATGNIAMGGFNITGLAAATSNGQAVRYEQLFGQFLPLSGGTMSGVIAMGANKITGLAAGTANGDALRYEQVIGVFLALAGGTMAGNIAMAGSYKLTGLAAGTTNGDSLRYEQVIGQFLLLAGGTLTGALLVPDGTVSAPSVAFSGDTNNGLYRIGSDDWGLAVGGVKAIELKSAGVSILGTNTNDNAGAGNVGEYVESVVTSEVNATSNAYTNITSISLTAGDWDVVGQVFFELNGATLTGTNAGVISIYSGNTLTDHVNGKNSLAVLSPTSSSSNSTTVVYRLSLSSTTTVYLKFKMSASAGTPQAIGTIFARRVR